MLTQRRRDINRTLAGRTLFVPVEDDDDDSDDEKQQIESSSVEWLFTPPKRCNQWRKPRVYRFFTH